MSKPKSVKINVVASKAAKIEKPQTQEPKIEFESNISAKIFDFLINSFREDYQRGKLTQERSGWRTLMDIAKGAKVSKNRIYGSPGIHGSALTELERLGIVEKRLFEGERGRGGKIVKVRVAYEKETVKRQVNQKKQLKS